jgi:phosphopantothenoylcysteine decarboxylase / phosphopantothenate---cysteine ligase
VGEPRGRRALLAVTGGIAAYKSAILARLLTADGAEVTPILTEAATRFVGADTLSALTGRPAYRTLWDRPGEVLHVRLAQETDVAVVAPCTANVIAKLAHGIADDLVTSTLLEYAGPIVIAPAMHTGMWTAPATQANVATLTARGIRFVGPVEGALAHGDKGLGRMSEPEDIAAAVLAVLGAGALDGVRVLVSAGPTHEPIDPVRFIGNRSSGAMGVAVADEAARRGAHVTLVLGPATVPPPTGVDVVRVETAEEMHAAVVGRAPGADIVVMAAAVADFRPKSVADVKLKKEAGVPDLVLEPTPDILADVADRKLDGQVLIGFAAETGDVEAAGADKLRRKYLDLLVANVVGRAGTGFGSSTNDAAIIGPTGTVGPMRTWTKRELAGAILDRAAEALRSGA